jgi:Flp pilus assembly protein TadD
VALTRARNRVWIDELTLWSDTVAKNPGSARAQMNYGLELMRIGRLEEAEVRFREAVRLAPFYNLAQINLGVALAARGAREDARRHYDEAVRLAPGDPASYYWRGLFLTAEGELEAAVADLRLAVERATVPAQELQALADALIRGGRLDEAAEAIARGAALDPEGFRLVEQRRAAAEAARGR